MEVLGALGALNLGAGGEIKGAASSDIGYIAERYKTQIVIPIDYEWSVGIMHFPIRVSSIEARTTFLCGKNTEIAVANFSGASPSFTVYYGFNDSGLVKWVTDANGYYRDKYHVIFVKVC